MKCSARLGGTLYEMEDSPYSSQVRITRSNPNDKTATFYLPVELMLDYVSQRTHGLLFDLLRERMKE